MHELTIAQGILDIALKTATDHQATRIGKITVAIGVMTGVVPESLSQGFVALAAGTAAEGAELMIQQIPVRGHCRDCDHSFPIENRQFYCPGCGSAGVEIVTGREMRVEHMEVE